MLLLPLIFQNFIANLVQALYAANIQFLIHKNLQLNKSICIERTKIIY